MHSVGLYKFISTIVVIGLTDRLGSEIIGCNKGAKPRNGDWAAKAIDRDARDRCRDQSFYTAWKKLIHFAKSPPFAHTFFGRHRSAPVLGRSNSRPAGHDRPFCSSWPNGQTSVKDRVTARVIPRFNSLCFVIFVGFCKKNSRKRRKRR